MRPLKLTLTAFGPYHETEIIDFEALNPYDLFVISGNTGAGKTSIFDGISYALFGGASGEDRKEAISLRSDFAPDELPTSAELLFSLRGKVYRIFRQLPYTKTGNKSQTPGKAELYEVDLASDDLFAEVSAVDRHISSEVDRKIYELIGLNKAQFNQLVMLPQGEYQRFLTSSTNDKEAILRTVFNTEKYQTLIQNLKVRKDTQHQKVIRLTAAQHQLLQSLFTQLPPRDSLLFSYLTTEEGHQKDEPPHINPHQALKALAVEASYYQSRLETIAGNITLKTGEVQKLQTTIAKAESLNQAFSQLEETTQALKQHQEQAPLIQDARKNLELAEKAQPIEPHFETVLRLREEANIALSQLKKNEALLESTEERAKQATKNHALEVAKEPQRLMLSKEIIMLESNQAQVEALAEHLTAQETLIQNVSVLNTQLASQKAIIDAKIQEKTEKALMLEATENKAMPAFQLSLFLQKLEELKALFAAHNKIVSRLESAQEMLKKDQQAAEKAQQVFDSHHQAWQSRQAALLAQDLQNGDHCPVCGSVEHPALDHTHHRTDHHTDENAVTQEAFTQSQKLLIKADAQFKQSQLQVAHLSQDLLQAQQHNLEKLQALQTFCQSDDAKILAPFQFPAIETDLSENALDTLIITVKNAGDIANQSHQFLIELRAQFKKDEKALTEKREEWEASQETLRQLEKTLATKNVEISSITAMIPAELQDITAFKHNLEQKKQQLTLLTAALETAQQAKTESDQKLAILTHQVAHEKAQADRLINAGIEARKTLDQALIQAGFIKSHIEDAPCADEESFISARLQASEMRALRENIHAYDQQLVLFKQQIHTLEIQLKDQSRIDLSALKTALQAEEATLKMLQETAVTEKHALQIIQQSQINIDKNCAQLEKENHHLQKIMEVYDLLRGDNPQKLSFERFILIAYFEQVIEAANLRLQKMTNGQFEFVRSENLASHGKQSGLDLDIYDAYTGEARDVKTLSGGEKFKASLSLSLGMADTIQAHQGGISIETLFIDEGFGSLDEESLLQALDVLIELQNSGKMIGVISHVEELKQTLPARIEVTKTKGGYSKTKIITQ